MSATGSVVTTAGPRSVRGRLAAVALFWRKLDKSVCFLGVRNRDDECLFLVGLMRGIEPGGNIGTGSWDKGRSDFVERLGIGSVDGDGRAAGSGISSSASMDEAFRFPLFADKNGSICTGGRGLITSGVAAVDCDLSFDTLVIFERDEEIEDDASGIFGS